MVGKLVTTPLKDCRRNKEQAVLVGRRVRWKACTGTFARQAIATIHNHNKHCAQLEARTNEYLFMQGLYPRKEFDEKRPSLCIYDQNITQAPHCPHLKCVAVAVVSSVERKRGHCTTTYYYMVHTSYIHITYS